MATGHFVRSSRTPATSADRRQPIRTRRPRFETLEDRCLMTLRVLFDYSLDASGFFNDSSRRDVLETAGRMLGDRLGDTLTAISPSGSNKWNATFTNPATGQTKSISNKSIAANTILVYV